MAWNPSKEVAVARDSAKALGDAPVVIVLYLTNNQQIGMASYGRTKELCKFAKELGGHCFEAMKRFGEDEKDGE